jgi:hypothetical protein
MPHWSVRSKSSARPGVKRTTPSYLRTRNPVDPEEYVIFAASGWSIVTQILMFFVTGWNSTSEGQRKPWTEVELHRCQPPCSLAANAMICMRAVNSENFHRWLHPSAPLFLIFLVLLSVMTLTTYAYFTLNLYFHIEFVPLYWICDYPFISPVRWANADLWKCWDSPTRPERPGLGSYPKNKKT